MQTTTSANSVMAPQMARIAGPLLTSGRFAIAKVILIKDLENYGTKTNGIKQELNRT
jgi:hypothetical protein